MKFSKNREKILDTTFNEFFKFGFHGMAIDTILKKSKTPKGSMYHFFSSKKDLLKATLKERIAPKVQKFFNFTKLDDENTIECLERIFVNMSNHNDLIVCGCPLHQLMVEMSSNDPEFDTLTAKEFKIFENNLSELFKEGIELNEFEEFNTKKLARFFIVSTWGEISIAPSLSSKDNFSIHTSYLIKLLSIYKINK